MGRGDFPDGNKWVAYMSILGILKSNGIIAPAIPCLLKEGVILKSWSSHKHLSDSYKDSGALSKREIQGIGGTSQGWWVLSLNLSV